MLSEPATDRDSPALASATSPNPTRSNIVWLAAAFILVGLNLRPGIASLSPLLPKIETALGLSALQMSMLTMLPVACLGLFGPLAPRLAARFGIGQSIRWLLALLSAGLLLRIVPASPTLFAGTAMLGAAIGMIGVLMPVVARVGFPNRLGFMMGVYTMSLCLGAAIATGAMTPLALAIERTAAAPDWSFALAFWAVPAVLAMGFWWQQPPAPSAGGSARIVAVRLWRKKLAWQVTGFMAAQSALAFVTFGWLPVILQDRGFSEVEAGGVASLSFVAQALTALLVPTLAARCRQQSLWAIGIMTAVGAGLPRPQACAGGNIRRGDRRNGDRRNLALGVAGPEPLGDDPLPAGAGGEQLAPHDLAQVDGHATRLAVHGDSGAIWGAGQFGVRVLWHGAVMAGDAIGCGPHTRETTAWRGATKLPRRCSEFDRRYPPTGDPRRHKFMPR